MTRHKIECMGVAGVLCALLLKEMKSPFAVFISLGTCVLIAFFGLWRLDYVVGIVKDMEQYLSLDTGWFEILLKITGITYLADFSANMCRDAGYSAIGGQIEIFGKITILAISSPVILALVETIRSFFG